MNRKILLICFCAPASVLVAQTSLNEIVTRAVTYSPELRAMRASVAEAEANALMASNAFRPAGSISTTPGYATGLPIAVLGRVPAIGTVEGHKLFYDLSARADELAARTEIESATTQLELRTRDTAQSAAGLYASFAADQSLVDAAQRRVRALETVLAQTTALRNEGRARELDVDRAAVQLATAKRAVLQAQTKLELDELRLRRLTNWPPGEPLIRPSGTFSAPSGEKDFESPSPREAGRGWREASGEGPDNLALAQQSDPVLQRLKVQIGHLQQATELQRRTFQPTIATQIQYSRLFDRYSRFYLHFKPDDFSVGATIELPFWTGGRRAAAIARLTAQAQRLTAESQRRQNDIEIAVREAEADLREAIAESDLAARSHELATEGLRVSEAMAREGRGEINDVPFAEAALAEADEEVANAGLHLATARARLLVLRGELPRMNPS